MSTVNYMRQSRILNPEEARETHVTICGVGTVGSNVAVQLAKAGFGSFELWDMDTVESHNIPSQDFTIEDLEKEKTSAVADRIKLVNPDAEVTVNAELSGYEGFAPGILVLAVDNMELRKTLFENSILNPAIDAIIDFRMGGWNLQCWFVDPKEERDVERYRKTLYSSDEVVAATCGTRTFAPVGALSGAVGVCLITQYLHPTTELAPPFYTTFDLSSWTLTCAGRRAVEVEEAAPPEEPEFPNDNDGGEPSVGPANDALPVDIDGSSEGEASVSGGAEEGPSVVERSPRFITLDASAWTVGMDEQINFVNEPIPF